MSQPLPISCVSRHSFHPLIKGVEFSFMNHETHLSAYPTFSSKLWRRMQDIPWHMAEIRDRLLPGEFARLYSMVHPYTMCGRARLRRLYTGVRYVVEKDIAGDIVECGVAFGGSAALMGLTLKSNFVSERENVDEDVCALGQGPLAVEVDLMQPLDANKKPAVHATPLNHVGLWVDDLPGAVRWMSARGVRFAPGGIRKGASGYDICFIHPKGNDQFPLSGEGVLIELVQAPADVVAALR